MTTSSLLTRRDIMLSVGVAGAVVVIPEAFAYAPISKAVAQGFSESVFTTFHKVSDHSATASDIRLVGASTKTLFRHFDEIGLTPELDQAITKHNLLDSYLTPATLTIFRQKLIPYGVALTDIQAAQFLAVSQGDHSEMKKHFASGGSRHLHSEVLRAFDNIADQLDRRGGRMLAPGLPLGAEIRTVQFCAYLLFANTYLTTWAFMVSVPGLLPELALVFAAPEVIFGLALAGAILNFAGIFC